MQYCEIFRAHCVLTLQSGREIVLSEIIQSRTYAGMLEGTPTSPINDMIIRQLLDRVVRKFGHFGTPHLLEPIRRNELGETTNASHPQRRDVEWLPEVACIGFFDSSSPARDLSKESSSLAIVWFQRDFGVDTEAMKPIGFIDWDRLAIDWSY